MSTILIIVQIILAICIVVVVLLQKSSSIGLGAYSGSNESLFGAKGPANFMAKVTLVLGFIFLVNTIALGYIYNTKSNRNKSVIDNVDIPKSINLSPTDNTIPFSSPLLNNESATPTQTQNLLGPAQTNNANILKPLESQPMLPTNTQTQGEK